MEIIFSPSIQTKIPYSRAISLYDFFSQSNKNNIFINKPNFFSCNRSQIIQQSKRLLALQASSYTESGSGSIIESALENLPLSVKLQPISDESQFDRVLAEAQQLDESLVILWMASWCRKCIYLKPKLEKLAADYYPRVRFYSLDVNNVPHKLVVRAGVTKMPTIQLWKDGEKQAEVIGGNKAHFVINDVRDMIEGESSL